MGTLIKEGDLIVIRPEILKKFTENPHSSDSPGFNETMLHIISKGEFSVPFTCPVLNLKVRGYGFEGFRKNTGNGYNWRLDWFQPAVIEDPTVEDIRKHLQL